MARIKAMFIKAEEELAEYFGANKDCNEWLDALAAEKADLMVC